MVWKAVGNSSLPIAPQDYTWEADQARERIFCWAGWNNKVPSNRTWKAFFAWDNDHPDLKTAYRLPFTDVINGELMAVPMAIAAIARDLVSQENELDLPEEVLQDIRRKVNLYYRKMHEEPPWLVEEKEQD